jgi:hypothetical protein
MSLGIYQNFPENIHIEARFSTSLSNKKLQHTIIQTLYELNSRTSSLDEVSEPSIPECTVAFEFGIAESNNFSYLNAEETKNVMKVVSQEPFSLMDFLCILRYYVMRNGKKKPLKFDYYMIRFLVDKDLVTMRAFHEKGPRYVSPKDMVDLVSRNVNQKFCKKVLVTF